MRVIVQKYGGSSVADLDRLRAVAGRIAAAHRAGRPLVVVVSAMGNTTSELIDLARQVTPDPDRRELDMLISVGERVSMALLAMALRDQGVPAISLTGSQSGIITDESHADARVVEVRPDRLRACLDQGRVVIVAGFQGVSRDREVTTLGRGGSDTTAVALAAALEAEYCEFFSDVDGVWSADPRVVPGARRLDVLSLDEALALARGGARVLHEDAVRYARDQGVAIRASSSAGPGSGTRIVTGRSDRAGAVAVAGDSLLVEVLLDPEHGLAALERLAASGVRVRRRADQRVLVDVRNAHGALPELPGRSRVRGPAAVATAVGTDLSSRAERVEAARLALVRAGIAPLVAGSGGDEAWFQVEPARLDRAVGLLHQVLVAPTRPRSRR